MSAGRAERAPDVSGVGRAGWLVALGLLLAVAALYAQSARHEFLSWDDGSYLTQNPRVVGGLTWENVRWAFADFHSANWHPLTWLSHQLDVSLFGLAAGKHHLVSAGLHALNALLCFAFLRRATGSLWASALVALLFAVHPLRVESVAWASERKDVLAGTFFFATLLAYERYVRVRTPARMGLVVLAAGLGLLAKPMLVTLPGVLLLLDFWPFGRFSNGVGRSPQGRAERHPTPSLAPARPGEEPGAAFPYGLFLEKLPLFALAVGSALITLLAQRSGGAVRSMEVLALDARLATAVLGTLAYLEKALWPSGLAFFYPHPALVTPAEFAPLGPRVLLGALLLVGLGLGAWGLRRRAPAVLTGWSWMLLMLLPVIGLVQVGAQFFADRYAYLPLLGGTLALVFGLRELCPGARARRALFALGLLAALLLGLVAHRQVATWRDTRSLCARALAVTQHNYVAHEQLGLALQNAGELSAAREQYLAALAIAPALRSSHSNLGAVYMQLGQRAEALAAYREALRLEPGFLQGRLNLGLLYELEGDLPRALEQYQGAAAQNPSSSEAWGKVGDALFGLRRLGEARAAYTRALALAPTAVDALTGLGQTLEELGEVERARAHLEEALRLAPGQARALHGLAWIAATRQGAPARDPARALALLGSCPAGERGSWTHLRTQAAALAAAGRFSEAVRSAAEASAAAPRAEWERLKAERELYAAGRALER